MGGALFASGQNALNTPRMARAVYVSVRDNCHAVLSTLFSVVATPIEGPGKTDFGDIDILVALPHDHSQRVNDPDGKHILQEAMARLGAVRTSAQKGKASMAIPWPAEFLSLAPAREPESPDEKSVGADETPHIQVDLALAPSLPLLHWALFKHAHGDFWNIVGASILRPLGLTVDETALWLRVPEIEQKDRKRAKVFLSDEPAEVLHFLGLEMIDDDGLRVWEQPFPSADTLFKNVVDSRFFFLPEVDNEEAHVGESVENNTTSGNLKSNDRRRLRQRPLFHKWATEYLPSLYETDLGRHIPSVARNPESVPTREGVRALAFGYFPGSEARFEAARSSYLREQHLLAIKRAVKAAVPDDLPSMERGEVCAAMRLHLGLKMMGADGEPVSADPQDAEDAAAAWTVDSVTAHIQANWKAITAQVAPLTFDKYLRSDPVQV